MRWLAGLLVFVDMFIIPANAEERPGMQANQQAVVDKNVAPRKVRINLEQAIQIALSDNPTMIVAGQEIELKKTAKKEALYGLLPTADLSGSYSRTLKKQTMVMDFGGQSTTIKMGMDNSYSGGLSISFPVFAPALYRSIHLTEADIALAVEKSRASKLEMVNQVRKAYYQLLLTQDSYEVLQKSYAQAEANFNVVNEKYKLGSVSEYDKIRADVQVRSLKPNVVSVHNAIILAGMQLKVLMGLDKDAEIEIEGNLKDYEAEVYERRMTSDGSLDITDNSDLKQLDLNVDLLKKNLHLQKTNFMPTLGASYNYQYTSFGNGSPLGNFNWNPYSFIGLNLTIPLFKGSNYTKMRQVRIQIDQLRETRIHTERMLYMQMSSYLDNMTASSEQVASNKESIFQAEKGRTIARKRYEVGKGTILELNDSEVALTQAQLTYNQSIYDYLVAKSDLEKVLGRDENSYGNK
jgi:outer membrane protein TolC